MIDRVFQFLVQWVLSLRYRVRVIGLDHIAAKGRTGILFLPNHPALIDPIIVVSRLFLPFRPRVLADQDQVDRPVIRWMAKRVGVVPIPDVRRHGPAAKAQVEERVRGCIEGLNHGHNLLLYPSGHIYRTKHEDLRGNSAVDSALRLAPGCRIVLVRTRGLWGSSMSMAGGDVPNLAALARRYLRHAIRSLLFFMPRREVTIELFEPEDLPRTADRASLNSYIERFYNEDAPAARYVPYSRWERGGPRDMPEPPSAGAAAGAGETPESIRRIVSRYISDACGISELRDEMHLAKDLGLDSLARTELLLWIGREFGHVQSDPDAVQTVGDAMLAARGQAIAKKAVALKPVPPSWFLPEDSRAVLPPEGATVAAALLAAARRHPNRTVIADQLRGDLNYTDLITAILVLKPRIEALPGRRLGILLPASCGATIVYFSTLFAEKTPVMVNWTTGARAMLHGLKLTDAQHVLTSRVLIERLIAQGSDFSSIRDRFIYLEDLGGTISLLDKLDAAAMARLDWCELDRARVPDTAVVLFTSGSEALPKAVPLTHANILTNLRDMLSIVHIRRDDSLIGFLPPFHSFGITVTTIFPVICGLRVAFHANPTESWILARMIHAYRTSVVLGTPTFLSGILRSAEPAQLASLRLAITGAEKMPERVYQAMKAMSPDVTILEGYGVTECSPIVSATPESDPRPGTIGRVLPSIEYAIVDEETHQTIGSVSAAPAATRPGMLLVRGPTIFPGYLGDAPSPFVEHDGKSWYRTGDLVSQDTDGFLTFRGRLKRFVKVGGEMISLPAIEAALEAQLTNRADNNDGPVIAVESSPVEDHPEIVLFTTLDIDRATANRLIREAGLSPIHNVNRVERIDAIPVLGTGKTDYRTLKDRLRPAGQ